MFRMLRFFLSLLTIISLAVLFSRDYKKIRIFLVIKLLFIEILFSYFLLDSFIRTKYIKRFSIILQNMLKFSFEGTNFVFGKMNEQGLAFFFLNVLCPIIFISALFGILQYIKVIPVFVKIIGNILSKISGMGKLESFNAVSSLVLGQSENFIIYKNILSKIPEYRIYTMVVTAISTSSMSVIGAYMNVLKIEHIITALLLNMFSTFVVLSLTNPYYVSNEEELEMNYSYKEQSFFEVVTEYILIGFKITIMVTAMVIGFVSLISAVNSLFNFCFKISFQNFLGYFFSPFAWIIGIPRKDIFYAGSIMATKLISNEFVAMSNLHELSYKLSSRSIYILSVFLTSFSNFSSVGILSGSIKSLDKNQGKIVSKYGFRLIYDSILINMLSASISGLINN